MAEETLATNLDITFETQTKRQYYLHVILLLNLQYVTVF